jgi:hypothetical protein
MCLDEQIREAFGQEFAGRKRLWQPAKIPTEPETVNARSIPNVEATDSDQGFSIL